MELILNRRGGVPVRDQLVIQLEMKILDGSLAPGQKLPSVRALARRLDIHANTVSAAYRDLEASGRVRLRRGAGVFVLERGPVEVEAARGLDEMIRLALHAGFRAGFSGDEIRSAVERWLAASPPDRLVVVDSARDVADLVAWELRQDLDLPISSATLAEVGARPALLSGALAVALPHHVAALRQAAPGAAVEEIHLEVSEENRRALLALPAGAIALLVSASPTVLPYASTILRSLRGDEVLVEARPVSATREWRRLLPAADLVVTDALAAETVAKARPRRMQTTRLVTPGTLERLREALSVVVPRAEARTAARRRR